MGRRGGGQHNRRVGTLEIVGIGVGEPGAAHPPAGVDALGRVDVVLLVGYGRDDPRPDRPALRDPSSPRVRRCTGGGRACHPRDQCPAGVGRRAVVVLRGVGEPLLITTGRRLANALDSGVPNSVVILDGDWPAAPYTGLGPESVWGAYLGDPRQTLRRGPLDDVIDEVAAVRRAASKARLDHGHLPTQAGGCTRRGGVRAASAMTAGAAAVMPAPAGLVRPGCGDPCGDRSSANTAPSGHRSSRSPSTSR